MSEQSGQYSDIGAPRRRTPPVHLPVKVDAIFGCWLWQGKRDKRGYARVNGRLAHRAVYEELVGAVPAKTPELDHLCQRRNCVWPLHLEPVTRRENERRKQWRSRSSHGNAVGDVCLAGHSMAVHGMPTPQRGKVCRRCANGR